MNPNLQPLLDALTARGYRAPIAARAAGYFAALLDGAHVGHPELITRATVRVIGRS